MGTEARQARLLSKGEGIGARALGVLRRGRAPGCYKPAPKRGRESQKNDAFTSPSVSGLFPLFFQFSTGANVGKCRYFSRLGEIVAVAGGSDEDSRKPRVKSQLQGESCNTQHNGRKVRIVRRYKKGFRRRSHLLGRSSGMSDMRDRFVAVSKVQSSRGCFGVLAAPASGGRNFGNRKQAGVR
jgi:hypothetical protein